MVDSLQKIDEETLVQLNLNKARMTLVDKNRSNELLEAMPNPTQAAGGSAANTAYWAAQLGGNVGFIGKISNDELGIEFKESVKKSVLMILQYSKQRTIKLGIVQFSLLQTEKER